MSYPSIHPAATPLPGGINPFDEWLPEEIVGEIASLLGGQSRINFEQVCSRFHSFATDLTAATERIFHFTIVRPLTHHERGEIEQDFRKMTQEKGSLSEMEGPLKERIEIFEKDEKELQETPALSLEDSLEVEKKMELENEKFLKVFKKRARELRWELFGPDFLVGFSECARRVSSLPFSSFLITSKINTGINESYKKVFNEILKSYSDQDIKNISLESFHERVKFLEQWFGEGSLLNIINQLRLAVKRKGDSGERQLARTAEIETLRLQWSSIIEDSPLWAVTRESIKAKIIIEKMLHEERRLELCGPTGFDGEINAAFQELQKGLTDHVSVLELKDQLRHIAQFDDTGKIIGGRLFEIERQLEPQNLDQATWRFIYTQIMFYELLNGDITESEENAEDRDERLNRLLFSQ